MNDFFLSSRLSKMMFLEMSNQFLSEQSKKIEFEAEILNLQR